MQKITWPISSHLDWANLVNNHAYCMTCEWNVTPSFHITKLKITRQSNAFSYKIIRRIRRITILKLVATASMISILFTSSLKYIPTPPPPSLCFVPLLFFIMTNPLPVPHGLNVLLNLLWKKWIFVLPEFSVVSALNSCRVSVLFTLS